MGKLLKTILNINKIQLKKEKEILNNEIEKINEIIITTVKNNKFEIEVGFSKENEEGYYDENKNRYIFPMKNISTCNYNIIQELIRKYYKKEKINVMKLDDVYIINWREIINSEFYKLIKEE